MSESPREPVSHPKQAAVSNESLRRELERRSLLDQQAREAVTGWSDDPRIEQWARVAEVDADNTAWLKRIVERQGWPRVSEVGEQAATAAWLLAQHADDEPELQRMLHRCLTEAVDNGDASLRLLAYLDDRIRVRSGRPQLYGTQFIDDGSGLAPRPIEDPDGLEDRRKAVGLESFREYEATMREIWNRNDSPDSD